MTEADPDNIRFASLAQVLDALHVNDAAALTRPPSLRRYGRAFLVDARRRLVQLGVRVRGNVDRGPEQWVELIDYGITYMPAYGRLHAARLESRYTFDPSDVRNRAAPVVRPHAVKPRFRRSVSNVQVEVGPLLLALQAAAPVGAMAAVEAPDTAAFTGTVTGFTGVLAATEAPDIAAFTGEVAFPLDSKEWLIATVKQRKDANNIPTEYAALTRFSKQLELQMDADRKAGRCLRALGFGRIRNMLTDLKLWPVK